MAKLDRNEGFTFALRFLKIVRSELQETKEDPTDVRLGWTDGEYHWFDGDVSGDSYHTAHCAASSVAGNDSDSQLRATARELLDQLEDLIA